MLLSRLPPLQVPDTSSPQILDEFLPFPRLPRELRDQIWACAASEPRIISLRRICGLPGTYQCEWDPKINSSKSFVEGQQRHPSILQATSESREEGLRKYQLCYEFNKTNCDPIKGFVAAVYINFSADRFEWVLPMHFWQQAIYIAHTVGFNLGPEYLSQIERLDVKCSSSVHYSSEPVIQHLGRLLKTTKIRECGVLFLDWMARSRQGTICGALDSRDIEEYFTSLLRKGSVEGELEPELRFRWSVIEDEDPEPSEEYFGESHDEALLA